MTSETCALTKAEKQSFESLDKVVCNGLKAFIAAGRALTKIRDQKLYRAQYATFEEYVAERHSMARRTAYKMIGAAGVVARLEQVPNWAHLPTTESQCRELSVVPKDDLPAVWGRVISAAERENKPITAVVIREVVKGFSHITSPPCKVSRAQSDKAPDAEAVPNATLDGRQAKIEIMRLVRTLSTEDKQEMAAAIVSTLGKHNERRKAFEHICKKIGLKLELELIPLWFTAVVADIPLPKKIDTPEVRKYWTKWVQVNERRGTPIPAEIAEVELSRLSRCKPSTVVDIIFQTICDRSRTKLMLARELRQDFEPPTLKEAIAYGRAMHIEAEMVECWFNYFSALGWRPKGSSETIDDWKQSLQSWRRNEDRYKRL